MSNPRVVSTLSVEALCRLAARQCDHFHGDDEPLAAEQLHPSARVAMSRLEHCFSHVGNRYFFDGTSAQFDHLHGDQYAMWLYLLAHQLALDKGPQAWCKKLFLLNKALHGCDIFYEVELPPVFLLVHPLGTVLGRARYGDHLIAYQRVSVGSNHDVYPRMDGHVTLHPGSGVLGDCHVGECCRIGAEALLLDRDLPARSLYIGNPRDHDVRSNSNVHPIWRT